MEARYKRRLSLEADLLDQAKTMERSDSFSWPQGAVAIARHHPVGAPFGRTTPRRLRFRAGV